MTTKRSTDPTLPENVAAQAVAPMFAIGYAGSAAQRAADDLAAVLTRLDAHANASDSPAERDGYRIAADSVENVMRMLRLSEQVLACAKTNGGQS